MSTFSEAVTLPMTSPSTITALANTWALILPFGPMVSTFSAQLDLALDLTLDRQIFAAAQLALDDHRFADVHDVPHLLGLSASARLLASPRRMGRAH